MSPAWARPVEQMLGVKLDSPLSARTLRQLVDERVSEGAQLEYKIGRYGTDQKGRNELAKDVCAFANHIGGLIVLGVAEVKGTATVLKPIPGVGDADARHIRGVIASWCVPLPDVDVLPVDADGQDDGGFILILVPPSSRAPHAVAPPGEPTFSWPVRHGSQTRWLSETELADAYRTRASRVAEEAVRLDQLIADVVARLGTEMLWLLTAMVPASAHPATPIDRELVTRYTEWLDECRRQVLGGLDTGSFGRGRAASRRVVFGEPTEIGRDHMGPYLELHTGGAAVTAHPILQPHPDEFGGVAHAIPGAERILTDEDVTELALAHLQLLSRHVVDNGGAWGEATAVAVLTDGGADWLHGPLALCHNRPHGIPHPLGSRLVDRRPVRSSLTIDVAAVANDPRETVIAARLLGGGLVNAFGCPELPQLTADGRIRRPYLIGYTRQRIVSWAQTHGVELTDDHDDD